ncbi:MAG: glycine zipper 2TM domain-containing protein [Gammaproteobacteria bacterium]|nr:glycine zipper 2TM domain-containing protein [Gammaproteobacteria bacterium]
MNRRTTTLLAAVMLLGTTTTAFADHDYRVARSDKAVYDYAKVISSQPMINYVTVRTPVRECWQDMQYYTVDRGARHTGGGALVGAIIGGVLGHQVGSGRGNDAATVAGTLIGAAIGSESARSRHADYGVERIARPVERCQTRYRSHREERIDGYRVTYRYRGQTYMTEMPHDPGRKIRVRVDVRPAG